MRRNTGLTTFGHELITMPERISLEDAGFCYHDLMTQETKCVYPKKVMLEELNGHMKSVSSIVRSFDIRGALEFEFMITTQQYGLKCTCMTAEKTLHIPPANKTWIQPTYGCVPDDCENLSGCLIMKLAHKHCDIDYLILDCTAVGSRGKRLYFVQVSALEYTQHETKERYSANMKSFQQLEDQTPLDWYSSKLCVSKQDCFQLHICWKGLW